jgi:hypothetical protein
MAGDDCFHEQNLLPVKAPGFFRVYPQTTIIIQKEGLVSY